MKVYKYEIISASDPLNLVVRVNQLMESKLALGSSILWRPEGGAFYINGYFHQGMILEG